MKRWRGSLAVLCVALSLSVSVSPGTAAGAPASGAPAINGSFAWTIVPSPTPPGNGVFHLNGVAATSPSDAWAVGDQYVTDGRTLIEHWNGTSWSIVPSPNVGTPDNYLYGVAALNSSDAWAVGYRGSSSTNPNRTSTLVQHWDGAAWSVVTSPNPSQDPTYGANYLTGVAAVAANNVWAVGYQWIPTGFGALIEHWDGKRWRVVSSPPASYQVLTAVAAISAADIWAVGYSNSYPAGYQTLTEHWDGKAWSVVASPNVGTQASFLNAVAAASSNDVWAVGYDGFNVNAQPLIEHWDGTRWSVAPSPQLTSGYNFMNGVAALGSGNVWAVGYDLPSLNGNELTLTEHWNGQSWSVVTSPDVAQASNYLYAAAPDGGGGVWAVGYSYPSTGVPLSTLVLHGQ